ncbi:hypothetical protein D3C73_378330 [compost metagenome]
MNKPDLLIANDIERAIAYVKEQNPACAQPLTEMIFTSIEVLRDSGYNITYLGSMLTGKTDFIFDASEQGMDDHERVFFHLMKVDQEGQAIDVTAFIAIDITAGTVTDCSANITTTH